MRRGIEAEEEHKSAEDGTWQDSDLDSDSGEEQEDQQDSGSDRDTHFNPDSSPKLPVDPEWSRSQALFEDAVGDGTYFAARRANTNGTPEGCWGLGQPNTSYRVCYHQPNAI